VSAARLKRVVISDCLVGVRSVKKDFSVKSWGGAISRVG